MRNRYEGDKGERLTLTQLKAQRLVQGDGSVAKALFAVGELNFPETGATVIEQSSTADELYFILAGGVEFSINGRTLGARSAGRTVGELSTIHQGLPRSATIRATKASHASFAKSFSPL